MGASLTQLVSARMFLRAGSVSIVRLSSSMVALQCSRLLDFSLVSSSTHSSAVTLTFQHTLHFNRRHWRPSGSLLCLPLVFLRHSLSSPSIPLSVESHGVSVPTMHQEI